MILALVMGALMLPAMAMAQDSGGNNNNRGDRGNRGGGFDPARVREYLENQVKDEMKPTDDEWKVIQPKLDKVIDARRETMSFGGGRGFRGRDRGDSSSSDQPRSSLDQARDDLRKAVENKDASADEISKKLTALREAKEKAKATLASAQKDLKDVLTQRQEAVLVLYGMLD
jgi:peptidoglycan hydrolase CwlO-like protein